MFIPSSSLNIHLRQIMFVWLAYLSTVILCIQYVYIYRDRAQLEATLCARFIYQSAAA